MKYAKAMYRGGEIISALDGNYNICKDLGIKCPFCSEALFWRKGFFTLSQSFVEPSFCHYKNQGENCELRAKRPEGIKYLKQLEIESHNQRLDLYNKKLWDIISLDKKIKKSQLKLMFNYCTKAKLLNISKKIKEYLKQNLELIFESSYEIYVEQFNNLRNDLRYNGIVHIAFSQTEVLKDFQEFSNTDRTLQKKISLEVLQFLSTKTGGYAFFNLFLLSLWEICLNAYVIKFRKKATSQSILMLPQILNLPSFKEITTNMIVLLILNTNWIKYLY